MKLLLVLLSLIPAYADMAPGPVVAIVILVPLLIIAILGICIGFAIRAYLRKKKQPKP